MFALPRRISSSLASSNLASKAPNKVLQRLQQRVSHRAQLSNSSVDFSTSRFSLINKLNEQNKQLQSQSNSRSSNNNKQSSSPFPSSSSSSNPNNLNNKHQNSWLFGAGGIAALALGLFAASETHETKECCKSKVAHAAPIVAAEPAGEQPVEEAVLTFAPNVPPPITRKHPVTLKVRLESTVTETPLTNKYKYRFWGFNGSVPGPFIRARVGDTMELTHVNSDDSGMAHNIDFHGVSGPGGGAPYTFVEAGQSRKSSFKLLNPGLYVYHCAAAPLPVHVANGMYGLLLVEPEEGMSPVDKEYYIMQSEFYFDAPEDGGSLIEECSYSQGLKEQPEVVVFNGREGSMVNKSVLTAKTGERVRMFFGNGGPNLASSFHVIGAIFDKVYRDADLTSPPGRNIQTTLVPPGGSTVVEFVPQVPGTYTMVDHAIFRVDKGAVGFLSVSGDDRPDIYHSDTPAKNCVGCKLHA